MSPFNRLFSIMIKPWVIVLFAIFLIVSYNYIDKPLAIYFDSFDLKNTMPFLSWITQLGLGAIYLFGFVAGALFFRYVRKNRVWEARFWFLWLCVVTTSTVCIVLKILLGRARPDMWFGKQDYGFYGLQTNSAYWSFPSGHTSTIMGAAFGLCILFPRYTWGFITAGLLVALSRVLLTQHYLTDVACATALALIETGFLLWFLKKKSCLALAWPENQYQPAASHSELNTI